MHSAVKSALLSLALLVATAAAAKMSEEELFPNPQEQEDFLPSKVTMDPGNPPKTGDEEYDDLVATSLLEVWDHQDSEVGDEIGWKIPSGVSMCQAYAVGDPHFRSFGNTRNFDFQGEGTYELTNCNNFIIQARSAKCGRRRGITCWYKAAVKYTDSKGNTDVIEVSALSQYLRITAATSGGGIPNDARPLGEIKLNGVKLKNQNPRMMKLKNGCYINKVFNGIAYATRNPRPETYIYCPGHNQALITEFAVVVKRPCCATCAPSLLGNDNCKNGRPDTSDDFKDMKGKNVGAPTMNWGNSFLVGDKNNLFGDNAKAYNHPEIKETIPSFTDPAFKEKAKTFCKQNALSYQFYQNCMTDAAASGDLGMPKIDVAAEQDIKAMESGENTHEGKRKIARELGRMDLDMHCQKDDIKAAMKKDAQRVSELAQLVASAEQQEKVNCAPVPPLRHKAEQSNIRVIQTEGAAREADRELTEKKEELDKMKEKVEWEDALIRSMLNILGDLTNIKSVDELDIDHESLNKAPKLKAVLVSMIEESRHFTGNKGNTKRIEALLYELLYKMKEDLKKLEGEVEDAGKAKEDADKNVAEAKDQKKTDDGRYQVQLEKCNQSKGNAPVEAYRQAQCDQDKNNKEAIKQLKEIDEEIDMIRNLQNHIKNWNNNKDTKKCPTEVQDISIKGDALYE